MADRAPRITEAEYEHRTQVVAELIAAGASRMDVVAFAAKKWGAKTRTADTYLRSARALVRQNWESVGREQMAAELLTQYADLQRKAREAGQLSVALGAINSAARLTKLIS